MIGAAVPRKTPKIDTAVNTVKNASSPPMSVTRMPSTTAMKPPTFRYSSQTSGSGSHPLAGGARGQVQEARRQSGDGEAEAAEDQEGEPEPERPVRTALWDHADGARR